MKKQSFKEYFKSARAEFRRTPNLPVWSAINRAAKDASWEWGYIVFCSICKEFGICEKWPKELPESVIISDLKSAIKRIVELSRSCEFGDFGIRLDLINSTAIASLEMAS